MCRRCASLGPLLLSFLFWSASVDAQSTPPKRGTAPSPTPQVLAWQRSLNAPTLRQRQQAALMLGRFGPRSTSAVPLLLVQLRLPQTLPRTYESTALYKQVVLRTLGQIGPHAQAAIPTLFDALRYSAFQKIAWWSLGRIIAQPTWHAAQMRQVLAQDNNPLGHLFVLERLKAAPISYKKAWVAAIARLIRPRQQAQAKVQQAALDFLGQLGKYAAPAAGALASLLIVTKTQQRPLRLRLQVIQTLARLGPAAQPYTAKLLTCLQHELQARSAAHLALDQVVNNPLDSLPLWAQALRQQTPWVRIYAAQQLTRLLTEAKKWKSKTPKQYKQGLSLLQKKSTAPVWIWTEGAYGLSTMYIRQGRKALAWKALGLAIKGGFNDYLRLAKAVEFKAHHQNPRFKAHYKQMRIAPIDKHEYMWLLSENQAVAHETSIMIMQNMNRHDSGMTQIFQSRIPTRATTSFAVLYQRWRLSLAQSQQRQLVLQSDMKRRSHRMSMSMLQRGNAFQQQQKRLASQRLALLRATQRRKAVNARRYQPPSKASTAPQPAPPLSTIR